VHSIKVLKCSVLTNLCTRDLLTRKKLSESENIWIFWGYLLEKLELEVRCLKRLCRTPGIKMCSHFFAQVANEREKSKIIFVNGDSPRSYSHSLPHTRSLTHRVRAVAMCVCVCEPTPHVFHQRGIICMGICLYTYVHYTVVCLIFSLHK